jgi:hypothetical protein
MDNEKSRFGSATLPDDGAAISNIYQHETLPTLIALKAKKDQEVISRIGEISTKAKAMDMLGDEFKKLEWKYEKQHLDIVSLIKQHGRKNDLRFSQCLVRISEEMFVSYISIDVVSAEDKSAMIKCLKQLQTGEKEIAELERFQRIREKDLRVIEKMIRQKNNGLISFNDNESMEPDDFEASFNGGKTLDRAALEQQISELQKQIEDSKKDPAGVAEIEAILAKVEQKLRNDRKLFMEAQKSQLAVIDDLSAQLINLKSGTPTIESSEKEKQLEDELARLKKEHETELDAAVHNATANAQKIVGELQVQIEELQQSSEKATGESPPVPDESSGLLFPAASIIVILVAIAMFLLIPVIVK